MDYSLVITRGLMKRCPRCGEKRLFHRWVDIASRCPTCAHYFERDDGYWSGAVALNGVVTGALFFGICAVVMVLTWPRVPLTPFLIGAVAFNIVFPLFFFPWAKTIWAAIDYALHPLEPDELEESSELLRLKERILVADHRSDGDPESGRTL